MKPLEGITVVELSTYIAAPSCGRILATQGARVIKVESPAGDVERKFGPTLFCPANDEENPIYDTLNGGKDHLMLDLKKPEDMERFHKLLAKADVFVTNNRLQALKKMRLDYDSLKERYPKLVYAILLGYGEKGPKVNLPGFDAIAMFATGGLIQDMMVDAPGSYPVYLPMGFGDLVCGTALAGAIGTALYEGLRAGKVIMYPFPCTAQLCGCSASCLPVPSLATSGQEDVIRADLWAFLIRQKMAAGSFLLSMNMNATGDHSARQLAPRKSWTIQDTAPSRQPLIRRTVKTASAILKTASLS